MDPKNDITKMKKFLITSLILFSVHYFYGQSTEKKPDQISVPQSSAFKLVDISPSIIETPATPKAFGLGILQNFDKNSGWPQNYSAEFTPYWWSLPKNRDAYRFLGIKDYQHPVTGKKMYRSNPFSALKMTNISIAFLQKDLIPDSLEVSQKVFSLGVRTTFIRSYSAYHIEKLNTIINKITDLQSENIDDLVLSDPDYIAAGTDPKMQQEAIFKFAEKHKGKIDGLQKEIQNQIAQKPVFQWDFAAAYASYGIEDSTWKTGRAGVWSTASLNLLLNKNGESSTQNYLTISAYTRYMYDNYMLKNDIITHSNSIDAGGRLSLEFDPLSVGFEAIYRNYNVDSELKSQRLMGFLNYRLTKDVYINAAFGQDFGIEKEKILTLFGLNWGFGNEKLTF